MKKPFAPLAPTAILSNISQIIDGTQDLYILQQVKGLQAAAACNRQQQVTSNTSVSRHIEAFNRDSEESTPTCQYSEDETDAAQASIAPDHNLV